MTLTGSNGTLTLSHLTGLSFTTGDGTADATATFTGTMTHINAALNGMTFTPTTNFHGSGSLKIRTNDQGNTGSGGTLEDIDIVKIKVTKCGNLICDAGETSMSCLVDCSGGGGSSSSSGPSCGNFMCESGETHANCPADCLI